MWVKRRASSLIRNVLIIFIKTSMKHVNFKLHYGDLPILLIYIRIIQEVQPDEIYNLGAMSHVKVSLIHLNM
jgi:GDPmannose 4,6-dehydratase